MQSKTSIKPSKHTPEDIVGTQANRCNKDRFPREKSINVQLTSFSAGAHGAAIDKGVSQLARLLGRLAAQDTSSEPLGGKRENF